MFIYVTNYKPSNNTKFEVKQTEDICAVRGGYALLTTVYPLQHFVLCCINSLVSFIAYCHIVFLNFLDCARDIVFDFFLYAAPPPICIPLE